MTLTVTAAQSGSGAYDGLALTVKAVTGAAGAGQTASSNTVTTPELSITPSGTGSWVYGALFNGNASGTFTAASGTTFTQNQYWSADGSAFGTFRTTGTTTNGTPVTVGASAPAEGSGYLFIALCEILAAGVLAEDSSSPATAYTTAAETLSTASFTPPPGCLLVAQVVSDFSATTNQSTVVTVSGGGLAWTEQVLATFTAGTGTFQISSVWTAQVPAVGGVAPPLIPPAPFTPMNFRRYAIPTRAPVLTAGAESGTGADAGTVTATIPGADTGTGTEGQSATPGAYAPENAAGTETQTLEILGGDTAAGTDAGSVPALGDTGTGTDAAAVEPVGADTGTGTETTASTIVTGDTAAGTEGTGGITVRPLITVRWSAADKLSKSGGVMP